MKKEDIRKIFVEGSPEREELLKAANEHHISVMKNKNFYKEHVEENVKYFHLEEYLKNMK